MSNFNIHQLEVFLAASETLNFTKAAQRLQITQPSVSQHIQSLEEHFGLALFLRSGRNIELTAGGMALVPLAREMVYLFNHTEETMASLKGNVYGHLIVGCSTPTGRYILPKLLASFHRHYPQVRATCHVTSQKESLEMLSDGKVNLALASNPELFKEMEFKKFISEDIVLIVNPDHPWAKRGKISQKDFDQADFILPQEDTDIHFAIRESLNDIGASIYELKTIMILGSLEAIALSVQEGLGVGFVPRLLMQRLVPDKVVEVEVKGLRMNREIFVCRNTRRPATTAQNAFWEFINAIKLQNFEKISSENLDSLFVSTKG